MDKTINSICNWIQSELKNGVREDNTLLPNMTKALAELVSARAKFDYET